MLVPFAFPEHWVVNIGIFVLMYAALATAWNIFGGYSGYLSLGHVAFFGIGAYAIAILFEHVGLGSGYRAFLLPPLVGSAPRSSRADRLARAAHPHGDVRDRHADAAVRRCSGWPSTCTG